MSDNTFTFVGRLTTDPELKFFDNGGAQVRFNLAVEKRWMNRQTNEWEKKTSFFPITCSGKTLPANIAACMKKGYRVIVTGSVEQRSWETEGSTKSITEFRADAVGPDLMFVTAELTGTPRDDEHGNSGDYPRRASSPRATSRNPQFEDPF